MGLDMYIFRGEKPILNKNTIYSYDKLINSGYFVFREDMEKESDNFDNLKEVSVKLQVEIEFYNYKKIEKEYKLSEEPVFCGFCNGKILFHSTNGVLEIAQCDISNFIYKKICSCFVTKMELIVHLANDYNLEEYIYDLFKDKVIENCEYYRLSQDMIESIDEYTSFEYNLSRYKNDILFYKEWN